MLLHHTEQHADECNSRQAVAYGACENLPSEACLELPLRPHVPLGDCEFMNGVELPELIWTAVQCLCEDFWDGEQPSADSRLVPGICSSLC